MTYQEIQDRLSKCESTLEQLKKGAVKPTEKITVRNLEILKESLQKQLSEVDKGVVYTDDEQKAKDLADDGANVKLTSEMKPGDEEDLERRRFNRLSTKDQNTLIAIKAMMDKEKATNEAPDGPPISKMSRADMIDFLNTTPEKVKHMSDDELRDYVVDKNADLRETEYDTTVSEQPADAPADLSEAVDPSITDLLVQFVTLMGMGYGAYQAAKKLSDKHGDIDLDSIKAALSKKEEKDLKENLTVVGHTPEEEKRNAEELVTVAKKAGRDAKIKYDGDRIIGVDIGAPGLGTPKEVRAVQDRQFDDYDKNKPKDDKGGMHKPARLRKLTVGGKTYEIGDFDPNDDGRIMSIEKYPNGYYITGGVYTDYGDGDEPKEGYGYALSLDGKEMDEEDLEGMYEDKEKDDYGRNHYPEKGEYIKLGDEEREAMKNNRLGIKENEIGDADDNVGMGYKNARDIINYLREKIYPYMDDSELQEFNDEMHTHFASNSSRFVKEGDDICSCCNNPIVNGSCGCPDDCPHCGGKGKVNEDDNPVPQGKHITVDDMQFMHDSIVSRMKMLAKIYKQKGPEATVMLGPNNDKEVKVVDTLKLLTKKKRELEDALQNKVAGIGQDQELAKVNEDADDEHMVHELIGDLFAPGNARSHLDFSVEVIAKELEDHKEGLTRQGVKDAMDLYDKLAADGTLDKEVEDGDGFISSKHVPKLKKAFELIGLYGKGINESDAQRKAIYATKAEKEKK